MTALTGKLNCPNCKKQVDVEMLNPELEVECDTEDGQAVFDGTIRLVDACRECGEELRQATLC